MVSEPFEFWDMESEETRVFKVSRYEEGSIEIHPRYPGAPESKTVRVLRLFLPPGIKTTLPSYWDMTSKHLIAALLPILKAPGLQDKTFVVQKFGVAPSARFSLEVS